LSEVILLDVKHVILHSLFPTYYCISFSYERQKNTQSSGFPRLTIVREAGKYDAKPSSYCFVRIFTAVKRIKTKMDGDQMLAITPLVKAKVGVIK